MYAPIILNYNANFSATKSPKHAMSGASNGALTQAFKRGAYPSTWLASATMQVWKSHAGQ